AVTQIGDVILKRALLQRPITTGSVRPPPHINIDATTLFEIDVTEIEVRRDGEEPIRGLTGGIAMIELKTQEALLPEDDLLVWTPAPSALPGLALLTAVPGALAAPAQHFVPTRRLPRATGIHLLWCPSLRRLWYVAVSHDVHLQYEVLSVSLLTMLPSTYIA